jgi:Acyl-ACP thioesterase
MSVPSSISVPLRPVSQDVDMNKKLRLTVFLQKAQEAAEAHATLYGCGYNQLIQKDIVWVLSRIHLKIARFPQWLEPVRLDTWHKRVERIFALRDFLLYADEHGQEVWTGEEALAQNLRPVVRATSAWLLMDTRSRRMQRVEHFLPDLIDVDIPQDAIESLPDKLVAPEHLSCSHVHTVRFSDIDPNHHVNNTKYVEWALDCLPLEVLAQNQLRECQINYNHEALPQDQIALYIAPLPCEQGPAFYVEGRRDTQNIFQCQFSFE